MLIAFQQKTDRLKRVRKTVAIPKLHLLSWIPSYNPEVAAASPRATPKLMLVALMFVAFVDRDGLVFDVPHDREHLRHFALDHQMIARPDNISNVYELLDLESGKKQLNHFQPLNKMKWLKASRPEHWSCLSAATSPIAGRHARLFC